MKKIFSFLTLAAALLCSGNAWAQNVAKVVGTGTEYTTVAAAITAAGTTDSILLLTNATCSVAITTNVRFVKSDYTLTMASKKGISNGTFGCKVVTNSYNSSSYYTTGGTFYNDFTGNVTTSGGTFYGKVTANEIKGGTFNKKVTITGANPISGGTFSDTVYANANNTIKGGTFGDTSIVYVKSISGGAFHGSVDLNVAGGTLTGGVFDNDPVLSAGTLGTTSAKVANPDSTKFMVALTANVTDGKIINGSYAKYYGVSEFADATTHIVLTANSSKDYVVLSDDVIEVGGTKQLNKGIYNFSMSSVMTDGQSCTYAEINGSGWYFIGKNITSDGGLTGGTFNFDPATQKPAHYTGDWNPINPSYEVVGPTDGKYTVQIKASAIVAKIGDVGYPSLAKAFSAASAGQTVTLTKDIKTNEEYWNNSGKVITLDLNGCKLYSDEGTTLTVLGNGTALFTICDSKGTGSLEANTSGGTALKIGSGGTTYSGKPNVKVQGVKVVGDTAINMNGKSNSYKTYITIDGGRFEGNLVKNSYGYYTISAGTFTVDPSCVNPTITDCRGITQEIPTEWIVTEIQYDISVGTCENGSVLIDGAESETVCPGTKVTLTNTPAQDYKLVTYMANGVAFEGNTYKVEEDNVEITAEFVPKDYVCQIGTDGAKFETLKEASAAVLANQTIYLTKNYITSKNDTLKTTKENVLVDLNGYAITFNGGAGMSVNGRLTLKNGSINGSANYLIYTSGYDTQIAARSPLIFENLSMNGGFNMVNTDATYINCTIDASTKEYYALYTDPNGTIGCSITIKSGYYAGRTQFACLNASPSPMTIFKGFFNSDPTAYKAEGCSVIPSEDAKYPYEVARVYSRENLTLGRIGTICLPYDVEAGDFKGANFYEIAYKEDGKVYFDQVEALQAGYAYIFEPSAAKIECKQTGDAVDAEIPANGLHGTFNGITADQLTLAGNYLVSNNVIQKCAQGSWLSANRAYIVMGEVPGDSTPQTPGRKRIVLGNTQANTPTELENVNVNANANGKMIIDGKLVIIRDGKMFNAQGTRL